ncbi:MAG: tRNA lysidine(34) synthetase TilS [Ktedonobacteraceae bacterium]|nr:tRNA lysidine(34) synthetase TilS [Ktedonobacteraceae bacterium]
MQDMVETVGAYIEQHQLFPQDDTVLVAVSGGADSLCLLHLLLQLCGPGKRYPDVQVQAAHLDHQLRGAASAEDARALARLAEQWQIPYTLGVVDVPALARREQRSLEDAARIARYRFLRAVAQELRERTGATAQVPIAVAHHSDDQVETLLLHWLRGGGIASMVGLLPRQQDVIRPLLCVTHADTLAYCQQHHLTPLEDASNTDPRFLRNRVRHELLPLLQSMNPGIRATLLHTGEVMQVDATWIEQQVEQCWPEVVVAENDNAIQLNIRALRSQPLSLQRHLLRHVAARLSTGQSPLELRHYKLIEQFIERDGEGRMLHLPHQLNLRRATSDTVIFEQSTMHADHDEHDKADVEPLQQEVILPIPGRVLVPGTQWIAIAETLPKVLEQEVRLALREQEWTKVWHLLPTTRYAVYIDRVSLGSTLRVRTRRPGDRMQPLGMQQEKKIQDILVDKHIARTERASIPLFFAPAHCVWLAGVTLDNRVRLTSATQHILRLSITTFS